MTFTPKPEIEKLPGGAFQPLLDEARRIADPARIKVIRGPIASRGFRSGYWTVERDGERFLVFSSVPDCCDFAEQDARVKEDAARAFAFRDLRVAGFPENTPE